MPWSNTVQACRLQGLWQVCRPTPTLWLHAVFFSICDYRFSELKFYTFRMKSSVNSTFPKEHQPASRWASKAAYFQFAASLAPPIAILKGAVQTPYRDGGSKHQLKKLCLSEAVSFHHTRQGLYGWCFAKCEKRTILLLKWHLHLSSGKTDFHRITWIIEENKLLKVLTSPRWILRSPKGQKGYGRF